MENIPQFLSHLPIWKANPLDEVRSKKSIKAIKAHQYDVVEKNT